MFFPTFWQPSELLFGNNSAMNCSRVSLKSLIESEIFYKKYSSVSVIDSFGDIKLNSDVASLLMAHEMIPPGSFFYWESTDKPGCCVKVIKQSSTSTTQEEGKFVLESGKIFFQSLSEKESHEINMPLLSDGRLCTDFPLWILKNNQFQADFYLAQELDKISESKKERDCSTDREIEKLHGQCCLIDADRAQQVLQHSEKGVFLTGINPLSLAYIIYFVREPRQAIGSLDFTANETGDISLLGMRTFASVIHPHTLKSLMENNSLRLHMSENERIVDFKRKMAGINLYLADSLFDTLIAKGILTIPAVLTTSRSRSI